MFMLSSKSSVFSTRASISSVVGLFSGFSLVAAKISKKSCNSDPAGQSQEEEAWYLLPWMPELHPPSGPPSHPPAPKFLNICYPMVGSACPSHSSSTIWCYWFLQFNLTSRHPVFQSVPLHLTSDSRTCCISFLNHKPSTTFISLLLIILVLRPVILISFRNTLAGRVLPLPHTSGNLRESCRQLKIIRLPFPN